jgi:FkbM family methyltransferase
MTSLSPHQEAPWKRFLKALPIIGWFVRLPKRLNHRYRAWHQDPTRLIRRALRGKTDLTVVQIGSNDGSTGDPISLLLRENPSWRALLVEPIPFLFERLRANSVDILSRASLVNAAIAETTGSAEIFFLDYEAKEHFPELPMWFDQLGGFNPAHIRQHFQVDVTPFIRSITVPTLSLPDLLRESQIHKLDMLHIDTEGFDWKVLRQLDLSTHSPRVILFEYRHLSPDDLAAASAFLQQSYQLQWLDVTGDCLAIRR